MKSLFQRVTNSAGLWVLFAIVTAGCGNEPKEINLGTLTADRPAFAFPLKVNDFHNVSSS